LIRRCHNLNHPVGLTRSIDGSLVDRVGIPIDLPASTRGILVGLVVVALLVLRAGRWFDSLHITAVVSNKDFTTRFIVTALNTGCNLITFHVGEATSSLLTNEFAERNVSLYIFGVLTR
jgi:hypothetical protein